MIKITRKQKPDKNLGRIIFNYRNKYLIGIPVKNISPKKIYNMRTAYAKMIQVRKAEIKIIMPKGFVLWQSNVCNEHVPIGNDIDLYCKKSNSQLY